MKLQLCLVLLLLGVLYVQSVPEKRNKPECNSYRGQCTYMGHPCPDHTFPCETYFDCPAGPHERCCCYKD
uniref:Small cysteine-rich protein n=1 Tax=Metridium senile TaxID=6116 RepID=SCRD_METSE|nr:RecName: Full=Small cysteine-rich protein; Short=Msen-SCRiP; Short=SCRiP; Flags: Precursor [Metridium senile]